MGPTISSGIKLLLRIDYPNVPSKSDGEYKCRHKFQNHFPDEYFNEQNIQTIPTSQQLLCTLLYNISTKFNFFAQVS